MERGTCNFKTMRLFSLDHEIIWFGIDPEFLDFLCPKSVFLGLDD